MFTATPSQTPRTQPLHQRTVCTLLICLFLLLITAAANANTELPPPVFPHKIYDDVFTPTLLPESQFSNMVRETLAAQKPNLGNEFTHTITLPPELIADIDGGQIDLHIQQTLLAISTQKGIQYYSNSRKHYRDFILNIYRVESLDKRTPLSDLQINTLQPSVATYFYKKDSSFGDGIFNYSILYSPQGEFHISFQNLQNVFYNWILLIATHKTLNSEIIITRQGNVLTIYGVSSSTVEMPFKSIRRKASISMLYRMFALAKWFEKQLLAHLSYKSNR